VKSKINYLLLDLDGTLILGNRVLKGAVDFVSELIHHKKKFLILTNNSSRSSKEYLKFMRTKGFPVELKHIFTSGKATCLFLKEKNIKDAYILGTPGVIREFASYGVTFNPESANLVVTFDTSLNYRKLEVATKILLKRKGIFVATHPDNVCPVEDGFIPDVGAFLALLREATGRVPDAIPGKPNEYFFQKAMEMMNAKKEETAIVGDRITTDIKTGRDFGITSILLLTGETRQEDLDVAPVKPDLVFRDLTEFMASLWGEL